MTSMEMWVHVYVTAWSNLISGQIFSTQVDSQFPLSSSPNYLWIRNRKQWKLRIKPRLNCKCKHHIIHSPQGFSGIFFQHWFGDFARLLKVQFTSNEGMNNDAPIHECESEIDHYTWHYMPYSLRRECGFFNIPQIYYMCKGLWDRAYGLSSLSEVKIKFDLYHVTYYRDLHKILRLRLGNASKYRHRVTPMPINWAPIFSDSVEGRTRFYRFFIWLLLVANY